MVVMIDKALEKRRIHRVPPTKAATLKYAQFVKNGYRLNAITSMSATFKLSMFTFYYVLPLNKCYTYDCI